jgi:GcrA cell cycle regulator
MSAHTARTGRPAHVWFPAEDQRLAELWDQGLPSSVIGKRMAMTKGSVLGRAHRLALTPRPNPKLPSNPARAAERAARAAAKLAAVAQPPEPETPCAGNVVAPEPMPETTPRAANDNRNTCQWPIGHPKRPGFRLCSASAEPTKPYCLVHCRIAFIGYRRQQHTETEFVPIGVHKPWR